MLLNAALHPFAFLREETRASLSSRDSGCSLLCQQNPPNPSVTALVKALDLGDS